MEADAKYTYVGIAVIALLMAVVVGVIWLKRTGRISDFNFYTVYFEKQNLDGLQIGADVSMRGIKVGRVEDYALTPDNINRVRALLRIDRRTPVSTNTVAVVNRRFVTGLAKIDLETGDPPGPPLEIVLPNENYPVIPEGTSNLDEIANRLNKVGETAAEALERLNDVLKAENRAAIEKTLANLRDLTGGLNQRLAELDRTLKSVQGAADNLGRASNSVTTFANNTDRDLQPALQQAETDAEGHLGRHDRARKAGQLSVAGGRVHRQLERRPADRRGGRTAGDRRYAEPPDGPTAGPAGGAARPVGDAARTWGMTMRRHWQLLLLTISAALATGCVSLNIGKDTPQQTQFRIVDRNAAPAPRCTPDRP